MDYIRRHYDRCQKCGCDNSNHCDYCSQCGSQLFYKVEYWTCSKCGAGFYPSKDKYCHGCGAIIGENGRTITQQEIDDALRRFVAAYHERAAKTEEQLRAEEEERRRKAKEEERRRAEVARAQAEAARIQKQKAEWRSQGRCQHCGGKLKGFWTLKCQDCGRTRDYIP